ncbi:extracellular serine proteinase-like [Apostichopus japonicus]|uniref:extracellular serine proteinase-like n=1 Tax=Stichopus japonicus TaxID=307972 RepID=UPI003AB2E375
MVFRCLLVILAVCKVSADRAPYYSYDMSIDGQFIIGIEPDEDPYELKKRLLDELGSHNIGIDHILEAGPRVILAKFDPKFADQVCDMSGVAYLEADGPMVMQGSKPPATGPELPEWNLDRVNQRDLPLDGNADYAGDGGNGTHVYLLDSGLFKGHVAFEGKEKLSFDARSEKGNDCNGHGTHAGAIIVSKRYGIAHNATIHGVRVVGCRGHTTISLACRGINYVARKRRLPCVMQIGSITEEGISPSLDEGVRVISKLGCVVVVPAGNNGNDACLQSPSRSEEVITVGALAHWDYIHQNSNWGKCVDIFAPGQNVRSAWYISTVDNDTLSGTSMSASHVTGAALLKLSSGIKPEKVKARLIKEATKGRMHGVMNGSPSRILYIKPPQVKPPRTPKPRTEL